MGVGYRRQGGTCPSNVEEKGFFLAPPPPISWFKNLEKFDFFLSWKAKIVNT
jgi:hypothetical protein